MQTGHAVPIFSVHRTISTQTDVVAGHKYIFPRVQHTIINQCTSLRPADFHPLLWTCLLYVGRFCSHRIPRSLEAPHSRAPPGILWVLLCAVRWMLLCVLLRVLRRILLRFYSTACSARLNGLFLRLNVSHDLFVTNPNAAAPPVHSRHLQ